MAITEFFRRHQRKIYVTLGIGASAYMLTQYVKTKFLELQERILTERLAKDNLERRFEQNQKDATFTILALLPSLGIQVISKYNVEAIRRELQALRSNKEGDNMESSTLSRASEPDSLAASQTSETSEPASSSQLLEGSYVKPASKFELWHDLQIQSLTRAFTLIYSSALLVLLTRLQLNILGRQTYVDSVKELASNEINLEPSEHEDTVNRQYLTFSWWILNKGWESLAQRVQATIEQATADINPRTELTLAQLHELFGKIQYNIDHPANLEGATFVANVLPPHELETYVLSQAPGTVVPPTEVEGRLREMLNETADYIESPNAVSVVHSLVSAEINVLINKIKPNFSQEDSTIKLASVLAICTKQAHLMTAGHPMGNDYIDAMVENPELDALCALIYTNF